MIDAVEHCNGGLHKRLDVIQDMLQELQRSNIGMYFFFIIISYICFRLLIEI